MQISSSPGGGRVRVVVATTVLLSFISFWRAAAIVLSDLGSSAFYVGGIVEQAIGPAAPWFVLGVMLFSYAVRALYIESSAMFVRAGVYRVVKEAMGGTLAKISVSALLFDYVLTGPISGVSAGRYIAGLGNDLFARAGIGVHLPEGLVAMFIAIAVTLYFWRRNTRGLHESSDDALRIIQITTVMVVILIVWCVLTIVDRGGALPPAPLPARLHFSDDALGWLKGTVWPTISAIAILVGFGHSILAMSGEESLAQVYREIERPKVKNLQRAGMVIFVYSLVFTGLVSFFATAIIPDSVRPQFYDNLVSGLAMHLVGPLSLRLLFQAFVVVVGFLILAGAANTAIVGSNGVLNRISEDGVLTEWFRKPHRRFGTTYRLINLIVALQLVTILLSRGDVYVLGEAYAFGVIWSFAFKAAAVLMLRYKQPDAPRPWRVPFNPRIAGREIPLGLVLIALVLFASAVVNLFTKEVATLAGVAFTVVFWAVFTVSERMAMARREHGTALLDQFQLDTIQEVGAESFRVRPRGILVPVRDYNTLAQLEWVLGQEDASDRDVVVLTVRVLGQGAQGLGDDQMFSVYEQRLFTRVVSIAERHGRSVTLLVAPGSNIFDALAQAAVQLRSDTIVVGESEIMSAERQAHLLGDAWDRTPREDGTAADLVVLTKGGAAKRFALGAHAPDLSAADVQRIHRLWVDAVRVVGPEIHHRDVVTAALDGLEGELRGDGRDRALARIRASVAQSASSAAGRLATALILIAALAGAGCRAKILLTEQTQAREEVSAMHLAFVAANEAANRAVLSPNDDAAKAAAKEAEQSLTAVQQHLEGLTVKLQSLNYPDDLRALDRFKERFQVYRSLDADILSLAVENTNLKAQRLAFGDASDAANEALSALAKIAATGASSAAEAAAANAALGIREIQTIQARHIVEANDGAMDRMESAMSAAAQRVRAQVSSLRTAAPGHGADLDAATAAFDRFIEINAQIVTLSRRNSNVRSEAETLGRKRIVAAQCEDQLRLLEEALAAHQFTATR